MSKYKVGDTFFVAPSGRFYTKEGYATIKKIGRKYAQIEFVEKSIFGEYVLNMENGIIYYNKSQVGVLYKTRDEYDLKNKKEKISEKLTRELSGFCGYKKLIEVSIDDLLKIAQILGINLDE